MNPLNKIYVGFYWRFNVCCDGVPMKNLGKIFYVTNDFGDLVMTSSDQLNLSLK